MLVSQRQCLLAVILLIGLSSPIWLGIPVEFDSDYEPAKGESYMEDPVPQIHINTSHPLITTSLPGWTRWLGLVSFVVAVLILDRKTRHIQH